MLTQEELLKLQSGSDIRGIAMEGVDGEGVTLSPEAANRIAGGFVLFLEQKTGRGASELKVAIGRDPRLSSEGISDAARKAMLSMGVHVMDCGLSSTPAMFMSTVFPETAMDGAVMVTAGCMPFNRNGLRFFTREGGVEREEVREILDLAAELPEQDSPEKNATRCFLLGIYSRYLCEQIRMGLGGEEKPLSGMHIVVDAGNGSGGFFAERVLDPLGADISGSIFLEPNGFFPGHIPDPENPEAMKALQDATVNAGADLGLIFSADASRMGAVFKNGEEVNRNSLIALIAAILASDYPWSTVVTDSVTSDELTVFLENELGMRHHRFKRGYKNVISECIRLNTQGEVSPLAIETSGHGALSENYYLDDGAYLAAKLIIAAVKEAREGRELSSLIANLKHPAKVRDFCLAIHSTGDCLSYGEGVLKEFEAGAKKKGISVVSPSYEGVRLGFEDGWALLRMSLHDPVMPLHIESRNKDGADRIAREVLALLEGFDELDLTALC